MTLFRAGLSMAWARALAAAVACTFTGCFAADTPRSVEVVVTNPHTGEPLAGTRVGLSYLTSSAVLPYRSAAGTTDPDGRVVLELADYRGEEVTLLLGQDPPHFDGKDLSAGGIRTHCLLDADGHEAEVVVRPAPKPQAPVGRPATVSLGAAPAKLDVAGVERAVDAAIPLGWSREQVEGWLSRQGIKYSYSDRPTAFSQVARLGAEAESYTGVVVAVIRDTDRSTFVTGSIQLAFLLGPDGRLARRLVEWVGTGP